MKRTAGLTRLLATTRAPSSFRANCAAPSPDRVDWSHELSLSLKHIAHAYELTGDIEDARAHYRESLEINQVLVEKQPGKEDLKADRREIEAALANLGGMRPNCPLQPQP